MTAPTTSPKKPTPKPVPQVTVPKRVFWVSVAAAATFAAAATARLTGVFPDVAVIMVALAGVMGVWWVLAGSMIGSSAPPRTRRRYARYAALAVALHTAWIITAIVAADTQLGPVIAGLVLLGVAEYGAMGLAEYARTKLPERPVTTTKTDTAHAERAMLAALRLADHEHLTITGRTALGDPTGNGEPHGLTFRLQVPPGKEGPPPAAAEKIAVALSTVLGIRLESRWVQLRKSTVAGEYILTVVLRDVMADVVPYVDKPERTSIIEPALVGYGLDTRPVHLPLAQHGQDIGKSRSGKTSLVNVKLAHLTRCHDALVWVCGAEKVYDLVAGWLEPYTGTDYPIPFDWVANGQRDTLNMLIAGMNVARWRQRQPLKNRIGWPHILIFLEEASFALRDRSVTGIYQGQTVTASQMAAMLSQGAGSANVWLLRATQRSTNDHSGDQGGDVGANVGYSTAFMSRDWAEIGRLMGDFNLPTPRHPGEYWLDAGTGEPPALLKAPYIQEVDPSKPVLHGGSRISDISWSRRDMRTVLDPGSVPAAGDAYRDRHTRMTPEMMEYLTGEPVPVDVKGPQQDGYDQVMEYLASLDTTTPTAEGAVTTTVGKRTRSDRIVEAVASSPEPMTPTQILQALRDVGDDTSQQVVTNLLPKLTAEGRLERLERGRYVTKQTHTVGGV